MSEHPTRGVLMSGMFGRERMGRGGVSVWYAGLLNRGPGLWAPRLWSCSGHWDLHSLLHGGGWCLAQVTCGKSTRIGGIEDEPGK